MSAGLVKCIAPWRALCIKADGNVVPDIQYRESFGNINQQNLIEILSHPRLKSLRTALKNQEFPSACINCQKKEASGGRSRRTFFFDVLEEHLPQSGYEIEEIPDIHFLELNTSNVCNLKCRMCSGLISSGWIKDEISIAEANLSLARPRYGVFQIGQKGIDQIFSTPEIFRNLQFLAIRGGEPLYEETNLYLFEKLNELGLTSQIHLDISTNGTLMSEKILKALDRFKKVELYLSLEGIGPAYQFIRGGKNFSIQTLEKNIKLFQEIKNVNLIFTFTTMVYNLGELNGFWKWYESVRRKGDEVSLSNIVANPDYLNFHILSDELKEKYFDEIDNGPIPKGPYDTGERILGDVGIESILMGLKKKDYFAPDKKIELQRAFKVFNTHLDQVRDMPIKSYLPEIADFCDQIQ